MKYFRRNWDENRGDKYSFWGKSIWFFEVDKDGYPTRQIEKYNSGHVCTYDLNNLGDQFGGLSYAKLELIEFESFEISKTDFEQEWKLQNSCKNGFL